MSSVRFHPRSCSIGGFARLAEFRTTPARPGFARAALVMWGLAACGGALAATAEIPGEFPGAISVVPKPFDGALRNPLMGITGRELRVPEWGTLTHFYVGWNEIENTPADGVDRIVAHCDAAWRGLAEKNVKVIPRVYLQYPGRPDAWPEGLAAGDFSSPAFARRLVLFIEKLGRAWNGDPRVAFVELGIFGQWGEHHSPSPSQEMQRIAGAAIARAFPDKLVSVRRDWETFVGFGFGEYWDSFAHWDEMETNGRPVAAFNRDTGLYRHNYIGGEVAYDWGNWRVQPGESPTVSLADSHHLNYVLNTVRWLQCTQLRWIGDYDGSDARAVAGAAKLQRALGYRFVLDRVSYSRSVGKGGRLRVDVVVRNLGSAPFYYRWPLEVSLLDPQTREVVWRDTFATTDVRNWLPGRSKISPTWSKADGDGPARASWPDDEIADWGDPPAPCHETGEFSPLVPQGRYVLALAILDPAGMRPAVCFATTQYWHGGRHPIGLVGIDGDDGGQLPETTHFDDQFSDQTLRYELGANTLPRSPSREQ